MRINLNMEKETADENCFDTEILDYRSKILITETLNSEHTNQKNFDPQN